MGLGLNPKPLCPYFAHVTNVRCEWWCGVQVTGLAVSDRHPYMFSAGLDKMVKCWDLEYNKVTTTTYASLYLLRSYA